ncbi:hypothetical protein, partial [Proteiniclasticum sp.]|uniref:hypothetical protein n=1 Tax=Proteiniclasticum sp. TaxID=2053595 RepID=UPI0028A0C995
MSALMMKERIREKILNIPDDTNVLIVLKGIPIELVESYLAIRNIDLSKLLDNKIAYLMELITSRRRYVTYEEFLLMSDLILSQYKNIYVLNNNIYMELYPINDYFPTEIKEGLLKHFSDDSSENDEEEYLGDIEEYTSIFYGIREFNGYLLGAYCDERVFANNKVININLFEYVDFEVQSIPKGDNNFIEILEEGDYIDVVRILFDQPDELFIRMDNYNGDKYQMKDKFHLLAYYWNDYTDIYFIEPENVDDGYTHNEEYTGI